MLDCLISPRWPHPPCLPSDIVPCLSWEQFQDTPTHLHVTYDILESDVSGRYPDDAQYEYTPKSCYYNLAKHCNQTLSKVHYQLTALGHRQETGYFLSVSWLCPGRTIGHHFSKEVLNFCEVISSNNNTLLQSLNLHTSLFE